MDPIKGAGAVDYSMLAQQNNQVKDNYDDYSTMPMVYEPEVPQKKSGVGLGTVALTGLACAAIGGFATHKLISGKAIKEYSMKAAEATRNYEAMKIDKEAAEAAKAEADKSLAEYRDKGYNWFRGIGTRFARFFKPAAFLSKEEKAARKAFHEAKEAEKKAAKSAKKGAEKVENAAKEAESTAESKKAE